MIRDSFGVKGTLRLTALAKDGSKRSATYKNKITWNGLVILAQSLGNNIASGISQLAVGTGTTPAGESDLALETEHSRNPTTTHTLTLTDANKVLYSAQWDMGAIVGSITEAGLLTTANKMFNRSVFAPFSIAADEILIVSWTTEFKNV